MNIPVNLHNEKTVNKTLSQAINIPGQMSQNKTPLSASVKEKPTTVLQQPLSKAVIETDSRQVKNNQIQLDNIDEKHPRLSKGSLAKLDEQLSWLNKEIKQVETKNDFSNVKDVTKGQDTKIQTETALYKSNLAKSDAKLASFNKENKLVEIKNDTNKEKGDTKGQDTKNQAANSPNMKAVHVEKSNDSDDDNHVGYIALSV